MSENLLVTVAKNPYGTSYLADPTSPIPSHYASIVTTSTVRVKILIEEI